jgi:hypothetical protein
MHGRTKKILFKTFKWSIALTIAFAFWLWVGKALVNQQTNYGTHSCTSNIMRSSLALTAYASKNDFLPAGNSVDNSKPSLSWRVAVLPFKTFDTDLGEAYQFDEPWNGPQNSKLHSITCHDFHCTLDSSPKNHTSYLTVQGPSTFFPDDGPIRLPENEDGLSNSILVVETHQSGIHWMEPRDLRIEEAVKGLNRKGELSISSNHKFFSGRKRDGAFVSFADGRSQFLNSNIDPKLLRSLLEIDHHDKPKETFMSQ